MLKSCLHIPVWLLGLFFNIAGLSRKYRSSHDRNHGPFCNQKRPLRERRYGRGQYRRPEQ
jgi:hypothetical protein